MKPSHLLRLTFFGLSTIIFKRRKPILGAIIVTDKCNLTCKHCAVSFNFHTPYPGTEALSLTKEQKKERLDEIARLIKQKYPILNLKSSFSAIASNSFPTPCYQCVVMENGKRSICGRCVEIEGLCEKCGYFFAAEYSMIFQGSIKTGLDMFSTYLKYL